MATPNHNFVRPELAGLATVLSRWYAANRRDLPWRPPLGKSTPVDPYAVLVSEFMLQQTQVATVSGYFLRFMVAFPTIAALAAASEHDVLRLWQGLGYYSRARNLHVTARRIATDLGGRIPSSVDELTALPGIGRYTAGAIASIAFDCRAPILDGNVTRVLCRLEKIQTDPRDPKTIKRLWMLAEQILPKHRCGQFNSAMMELGATVCTPRQPQCPICPVKRFCQAAAAGLQEAIPPPQIASDTDPRPLDSLRLQQESLAPRTPPPLRPLGRTLAIPNDRGPAIRARRQRDRPASETTRHRSARNRTNPAYTDTSAIRFHGVHCDGPDHAGIFQSKMDSPQRFGSISAVPPTTKDCRNAPRFRFLVYNPRPNDPPAAIRIRLVTSPGGPSRRRQRSIAPSLSNSPITPMRCISLDHWLERWASSTPPWN